MSWIERDDLVRLIAHVIATPELAGPVNATAPKPVTNTEFTEELGRAAASARIFPLPGRCCTGSAAISPTSCCSAASACCRQGAQHRFCVSPRNPAQRVRSDPVRGGLRDRNAPERRRERPQRGELGRIADLRMQHHL